jgi:hypothetical protein
VCNGSCWILFFLLIQALRLQLLHHVLNVLAPFPTPITTLPTVPGIVTSFCSPSMPNLLFSGLLHLWFPLPGMLFPRSSYGYLKCHPLEPGVVAHAPSTWEVRTGGSKVHDQLELHSETLCQK